MIQIRNFLIVIFSITLILSSCNPKQEQNGEDDSPLSETNTAGQEVTEEQLIGEENFSDYTFLEYAELEDYLSTFASALEASGLMDSINMETGYTLFAPTDQAFDQLPEATLTELLLPENKEDLINILQYHIYPNTLRYNDITEGMTVNTLAGEELLFNEKESGMIINGDVTILDADIETKNGLVHIVNKVMLPPNL